MPALGKDLAGEQRAFLRRDRARWGEHLTRIRSFLGEGLQAAGDAPVIILGAGSGLEIPWRLAPPGTVGWDGDPWSRVRTLLRHGRLAPWVFQDLTGGLAALHAVALRTARQPWSGRVRTSIAATRRLAGLAESLVPAPDPLRAWIRQHRPGTILVANVMGQFGPGALRVVDLAFRGRHPWTPDPEETDPLLDALDHWTARAVRAFLGALLESGADLWLVHDRGVLFGHTPVSLGPMEDSWVAQLRVAGPLVSWDGSGNERPSWAPPGATVPAPQRLEASDPLCGVDVLAETRGREVSRHHRWVWPVASAQTHIMEAMRIPPMGTHS